MKVLIATGLYPPEIGGPATYSKTLEAELPRRGVEAKVLPFRRARRFPKVLRHIAYFFLIIRESRGMDLIYAQDPVSVGFPAWLAAFILRKPFALKVVGDYAWEQSTQRFDFKGTLEEFQYAKLDLLPGALRFLERFVAKRAKRVVVPSKYLGRIVSKWGVEKRQLIVIYNGIEPMGDTGNKSVLRGLIKFHGKLIVSVGRLVPWKGFPTLIHALPKLRERFPDVRLMIIGGGPDLAKLEETANETGVADDVIFTGALERDVLIRYLRASDVFVLNTAYEGFSHLLLEAFAIGVPVVTTKVGGNPEIVEDRVNGYLVKFDDADGLIAATSALLGDATLRTRIVTAAKRTSKRFTNERMVDETAKLLKTLCAS